MIGIRLTVQWAGNKWYAGTVREYKHETGEWLVQYDDNDRRWYKLAEKTFRILGSPSVWEEKRPGEYDTFADKWVPYLPKDPHTRTITRFHCLLEHRLIATTPGARVCIRGSAPILGDWNVAIPMVQDDVNRSMWVAEVELPFDRKERCDTGLFEYKYTIEVGPEVLFEGQKNRRERVMKANFYGAFRPDKENRLTTGSQKHGPRAQLGFFVETEVCV
jgi:hypothetical protein